MSIQRIMTKSPLRTQSHSTATFTRDDHRLTFIQHCSLKSITNMRTSEYSNANVKNNDKIIESQHSQINEMKQFISDCQISLIHFKQQLEDQLSIKQNYDQELRQLNQLVASLKSENQQLVLLYNEKKNEVEELTSNNLIIINDFNKQFETTLKARIEKDIKEIHNKYLREIQLLKTKLFEQEKLVHNQEVIRLLQKKCEDLLQSIDQKNYYIDDLLIKYGELDEKYENLKKQMSQKLYEEEILDDLSIFKLNKS
ncbi:unnamed protein product (macronuclear) [Paramecium tetraurelia]|uniref:Uncharacterized protein n=1 Tax=Paramecium tetraurelia TaxID=5888 RepID=A0DVN3_PARTE|nr:uncharacterized protein GSPATT00020753001 [Paramecium tetraurelia]CAK87100.1 unnamed protein product [Paramecium tetraurelia]|eukprot:XP_001454497.1 hypothetical protein (macronuclear) [Paramecium tetraurelia strain d4-2]